MTCHHQSLARLIVAAPSIADTKIRNRLLTIVSPQLLPWSILPATTARLKLSYRIQLMELDCSRTRAPRPLHLPLAARGDTELAACIHHDHVPPLHALTDALLASTPRSATTFGLSVFALYSLPEPRLGSVTPSQ